MYIEKCGMIVRHIHTISTLITTGQKDTIAQNAVSQNKNSSDQK